MPATATPPRSDRSAPTRTAILDGGAICFGAWVDVIDDTDTRHRYRIVGADETDGPTGAISLHSPVARALLGRSVGDVVLVELPAGQRELEIEAITY